MQVIAVAQKWHYLKALTPPTPLSQQWERGEKTGHFNYFY